MYNDDGSQIYVFAEALEVKFKPSSSIPTRADIGDRNGLKIKLVKWDLDQSGSNSPSKSLPG